MVEWSVVAMVGLLVAPMVGWSVAAMAGLLVGLMVVEKDNTWVDWMAERTAVSMVESLGMTMGKRWVVRMVASTGLLMAALTAA